MAVPALIEVHGGTAFIKRIGPKETHHGSFSTNEGRRDFSAGRNRRRRRAERVGTGWRRKQRHRQRGKGEQFFPVLVYRTGAYAPNGTPWANGYVDYLKLVNAQGGINGVKITFEECETGYATDRGVECYERLKGKGPATMFQPLSTGITFALTDKTLDRQDSDDHRRLRTLGVGRRRGLSVQLSADGHLLGPRPTFWCSTSASSTAESTS